MNRPAVWRLTRAECTAAAIWTVLAIVVGNTVYDLLLTRGLKEFKFHVALHDAGMGPEASLSELMAVTVFDATWIGLLFGSFVAITGFATIWLLRRERPRVAGTTLRQAQGASWDLDGGAPSRRAGAHGARPTGGDNAGRAAQARKV
ncbi:hypothetical protein BH23ACI1_BH23ACI1_10670 [soil metagenome]|nr:hypothetical protein [Acidobacteriota bacterium]